MEGSGIYVKAEAFSTPDVTDAILESREISDVMLKGFVRKEQKDTALFRLSTSNKHKVRILAFCCMNIAELICYLSFNSPSS